MILPKDYSTFVEEESLDHQETKAGIRVVVYGYFVGLDTDDLLSVIRATNQLRENNPNVQQSYVVSRYDEELNGDPVVLDTATQGVFPGLREINLRYLQTLSRSGSETKNHKWLV